MDAAARFSGKAEVYDAARPGYPAALADYIEEQCGLPVGACVADVGAGTGKLSALLLARGWRVYAVEPNADMREKATAALGENLRLTITDGAAEATGLAPHSVQLVTAAQAFHWFDAARFREECRRILKPDGYVALIWNHRDEDSTLVQENAELCRRLCPGFRGFSGGRVQAEGEFRAFFRSGAYECRTFPHPLPYSRETFIGRGLSASYAPRPGDENYGRYVEETGQLFDRYAHGGTLLLPNYTQCYIGQV